MDKLLVEDVGMGIVTNNGASILRETVDHPVADLVADVAITQEEEVGDGTTAVAAVASELLGEAEQLIDQDIHPTTITAGYLAAAERAVEALENIAIDIEIEDTNRLIEIAKTAMTSKATLSMDETIAMLVVEAVRTVADEDSVNLDNVAIEKITGGRVTDSLLMDGVIIDKERADSSFPYRVEDANIVALNKSIEFQELSTEPNIDVSESTDLDRLGETKHSEFTAVIEHLTELGVDAVVCGQNIETLPRAFMSKRGMYAVRRVDDDDLRILARATGSNIVSDPRDVTADDVGHAEVIQESDIDGDRKTNVRGCKGGEAATLVLYGATKDVVDEVHRAVEDAIEVVALTLRHPRILPGGGAAETAVARELREYATKQDTREQLAIEGFGNALDVVPRTLAENAGVNPIDGTVNVRAAQVTDTPTAGLDGETGEVIDTLESGIVEPLSVKHRLIRCAAEVAIAVLRIDGVLPKRDEFEDENETANKGMPSGMGSPGTGER
jgi:chaperonin GroEL (HSP60 family)